MVAITTTKEESSEDFGTRLFEQVKVDNRAKEKAFRKREKREAQQKQIMELSTKIGMGIGDAYFQNKTNDFLNTEEVVGNVLTTRNAYKIATKTTATEDAANNFEGGVKAYWLAQGQERVRADIDKQFGTIRNKTQYSNAILGAGSEAGNRLQKAHEERLKLTNDYLSKRGVDEGKDVFLNELKKNNPKNVGEGITQFLGRFVGLSPSEQMNERASHILDSASELTKFQDAYKKTGDGVYSQIVAENTPDEFFNPAPVLGELKERKVDSLIPGGQETTEYFRVQTTTDRETGRQSTLLVFYDSTGKELTGDVSSKQVAREQVSFNAMVTGIMGTSPKSEAALMSATIFVSKEIEGMKPGEQLALNTRIDKAIERRFQNTRVAQSVRKEAHLEYEKLMNARVGAAAQMIARRSGMKYEDALYVSLDMFLANPTIDGTGAFRDGVNPFNILASVVNTTTTTQEKAALTRFSTERYEELSGPNGINFVESYLGGSKRERASMRAMYDKIVKADISESVPYDQLHIAFTVANVLADNGLDPSKTLKENITTAEGFVQQGLIDAAEVEAIALEEKARLGSSKGVLQSDENPLVPEGYIDQTIKWAKQNPAQAALFVGSGLLFLAPLAIGGAGAGAAAAVGLGARALSVRASPTILKFIRQSFSKPKVDVPAPASVVKPTVRVDAKVGVEQATASELSLLKPKIKAGDMGQYVRGLNRKGRPLSKEAREAQEALKRPATTAVGETTAPLSGRKIAGAGLLGAGIVAETLDTEGGKTPEELEEYAESIKNGRGQTSLLNRPPPTPTPAVTSLISTALSGAGQKAGSFSVSPEVVNAVFNIETNASDPISVRAVQDSGHDAHGIGQVKTATAVQPGHKVENVFTIAARLGIAFDTVLQIQASGQASKAFKPITGKAGEEVVRLLQIPEINAAFSVSYLNAMSKRYEGDLEKVFLAYNQGPRVADKFNGNRSTLTKEGKGYLEKAERMGVL